MTLALISTNPRAIIGTFADNTTSFRLPNGDIVYGAEAGWTGEGYALVTVAPFLPGPNLAVTGQPTFSIDENGNVTETFATVPFYLGGPAAAASYRARLRSNAATLQARGQSFEAVSLLLEAAGVQQ